MYRKIQEIVETEKTTCLALLLLLSLCVSVISASDCGCGGGPSSGSGSDMSSGYGSSENPVLHMVKARELLERGDLTGALDECRESLALDPNNVPSLLLEGEIFFQMGEYREAAAVYRKVTEISPADENAYTRLGNTYFLLGEYEEAKKAYTRSLAIRPNDPVVKENLEKVERLSKQKGRTPVRGPDVPQNITTMPPGIQVNNPLSIETTRIPSVSPIPTKRPAIALSPVLVPAAFVTIAVTFTRRARKKIESTTSVLAR
jgi:tetratricopeptide (TPR) repeat protein